ncbi:MAG TPA: prephenate dehydrogenase [Bryobacterales bacterium]|nr:prephenate dehydrogenase [Bryobacterales bacterium]
MNTVTIVGVGLIGGSFALGLKKNGFTGRILGVSSERTIAAARELGVIDEGLSLEQAVPQADLVYLAQPISRILEALPRVAELAKPSALVTDAGSTKRAIVARASEVFGEGHSIFLGGHPMAGKAVRGVQAAEADLLRDATYVLTPPGAAMPLDERVGRFGEWLGKLGARVVVMDPAAHDQLVAFTSHLPQMAATALASLLLDELSWPDSWRVAGAGLRDMTRLAGSAYELWRDIAMTNGDNINRALARYIQSLEHVRENLRTRALEDEFQRGGHFVTRLGRAGGGSV